MLVPVKKIKRTSKERESAALEIVKLHQLVITDQREENLVKPIEPEEALEEEDIEDVEVCLITTSNDTINSESWLNKKGSGYRTQKATLTVKERVGRVETFSNYLISPLRKRYDVFFRSTMCTLKAIRCWLKMKPTESAPRGWVKKREKINDRIEKFERISNYEATIEEIDDNQNMEQTREERGCKPEIIKNRGRLNMESRRQDAYKALDYNILRRTENEEI